MPCGYSLSKIMRIKAEDAIANNDRQGLIRFLVWVDGNGIWRDSDSIDNDMDPITFEDAKAKALEFLANMD